MCESEGNGNPDLLLDRNPGCSRRETGSWAGLRRPALQPTAETSGTVSLSGWESLTVVRAIKTCRDPCLQLFVFYSAYRLMSVIPVVFEVTYNMVLRLG